MVFQTILNMIFPTCASSSNSPTPPAANGNTIPPAAANTVPPSPSAPPAPAGPPVSRHTQCDPDALPVAGADSNLARRSEITVTTAAGVRYGMALSAGLQECVGIDLLVTVDPPLPPNTIIDPSTLDVAVHVFFWTSLSKPGSSCDIPVTNASDCVRMWRRLPLRQDLERGSQLYAKFVPDGSSFQYAFVLEVSH